MKLCSKGCGRETPGEKYSYCRECQREYAKRRYMDTRVRAACAECGKPVDRRRVGGTYCLECWTERTKWSAPAVKYATRAEYQAAYRFKNREKLKAAAKEAYAKTVAENREAAERAGMSVSRYVRQLRKRAAERKCLSTQTF